MLLGHVSVARAVKWLWSRGTMLASPGEREQPRQAQPGNLLGVTRQPNRLLLRKPERRFWRDPSARHLSIIVLFPQENQGSPPHTNYRKCCVEGGFFSPLVLFSGYVEPAEKVFISVCKLNALGVFLQLCPRLCWMWWWSWMPRQTPEERTRREFGWKTKLCFVISCLSKVPLHAGKTWVNIR